MSNYFYNYEAADFKMLDSVSGGYSGFDIFIGRSEAGYWKNRVTKIINDGNINNDEEYKKIFKLINGVTTDFQDLQWKIQGEFMSLYIYFMTRLYANAIAKDIDKVDPKKLKEEVPDEETDKEPPVPVTPPLKKRKRVSSPTITRDIESTYKTVGSRLD
jgi:hypothetical protein